MIRTLVAWLKASRLASQSTIALGLLFGQALAYHQTGQWSWWIFALVHAYGLFDQLYIVYANDYADHETDANNDTFTIFSGGSRALVDGDLEPRQVGIAAIVMAVLCGGVGLTLGLAFGLWWALPLILSGLVLLWAYSFPPLKLSYRGGGELLQTLGVGLVLPLVGFYAQAGSFEGFRWELLWVVLPLELTCAMCTALPDEPSDRLGDKNTSAVMLGVPGAQLAIFMLNLGAIALFPLVNWMSSGDPRSYLFILFPLLVNLATLALRSRAKPGTRWMIAFVFLGLLVTISLMGTMIVALFLQGGT